MKSKNFIMAIVLLCLISVVNLHAQLDINGQITGKVADANGVGIKQIHVFAMNLTTLDTQVQMTNNFGNFKFEGLTLGSLYLLQVSSVRHTFTFRTQTVNMNSVTKHAFFTADDTRFNLFAMPGRDF
jgi:hypothetical protein